MNDPLADLIDEVDAAWVREVLRMPPGDAHSEASRFTADWLRSNRDRVLEALGGWSDGHGSRTHDVWLFAKEEDQ